MYGQTITLADPATGSEVATETALVLLPGIVGNNTYRRKVLGAGTNGHPCTMDIKGEILTPSGNRKYSVARLSLVINQTLSSFSGYGAPPVAAVSLAFNAPFGTVDGATIAWADAAEALRVQICWMLQYVLGRKWSLTAVTGESALFSSILDSEEFAASLSALVDGVR